MNAKEKLNLSQLRILNTNALRLFGCLLYNFNTIYINSDEVFPKGISDVEKDIIKQYMTAMATVVNGKPTIGFYSSFIDECEPEELTFVNLHEIIHILDKHHTAGNIYPDMELHNLAADHIINTALKKDIDKGMMKKVKMPEHAFIIKELVGDKNYTTVAEVYNWLIDNATKNGGMKTLKGGLKYFTITINGKDQHVVQDLGQSDDALSEDIADALQAEARTVLETAQNLFKGDISGSAVNELIKNIVELEIPWTSLLDKSVAQKIVPDEINRSWKGLQKRPMALGLYYPIEDITEKPSQLVILEDQSGSITKQDIKKFASVLMQSIRYFDEVRIMRHDIKIHHDKIYQSNQTSQEQLEFEAGGRGGTSHRHVFKRIQKSFEDGDDLSLVILLTDFFSDIEQLWNRFEWTKHIPVTVVCNSTQKIPLYIDKNPIYIK